MRKVIFRSVLMLCGFVMVYTAAATSAEVEKKGKPSCIFHMDSMKDAKYEVTNIPEGVTIRITSDNPETVEKIQESMAQCQAAHKSGEHKHMCPMHKNEGSSGRHE